MKKPLLKFIEEGKIFHVFNHKDEFLGVISRGRVGKFRHWTFCPQEQTYFTNGCLKEIVEFITKLYGRKK